MSTISILHHQSATLSLYLSLSLTYTYHYTCTHDLTLIDRDGRPAHYSHVASRSRHLENFARPMRAFRIPLSTGVKEQIVMYSDRRLDARSAWNARLYTVSEHGIIINNEFPRIPRDVTDQLPEFLRATNCIIMRLIQKYTHTHTQIFNRNRTRGKLIKTNFIAQRAYIFINSVILKEIEF